MMDSIAEALKSLWWVLFIASFMLAIFSFFWGFVDLILMMRFDGKIKRGIKIWSKPLADDITQYLLSLSKDVVETKKNWISESKIGFIRVEEKKALIYYRRPHWGTSWPYVGYVDLSVSELVLEFRSSLPMHLFLLPFVLTGVGIPFVVGLLVFNYFIEAAAIENFLKRKSSDLVR